MKGGSVQRSTLALMSVRGLLTLKTFSALFRVPVRPVIDSIAAVSRGGSAARTAGVTTEASNARAIGDERNMESPWKVEEAPCGSGSLLPCGLLVCARRWT